MPNPDFNLRNIDLGKLIVQPDLSHLIIGPPIARVNGRLPDAVRLSDLGITIDAARTLTPKAAGLTKGDLVALGGPNRDAAAQKLGLTTKDISSIRAAFQQPIAFTRPGGALDVSVSCCCCTPCCCAAVALSEPHLN
jgi:hypothetical protein